MPSYLSVDHITTVRKEAQDDVSALSRNLSCTAVDWTFSCFARALCRRAHHLAKSLRPRVDPLLFIVRLLSDQNRRRLATRGPITGTKARAIAETCRET